MKQDPFIRLLLLAVLIIPAGLNAQQLQNFVITRLPFNSPVYNDISPVLLMDDLVFCSDRRFSGITDRTAFDGRRLFNIYIAERKDSADWKRPVELKSPRSKLFNNGPLCFSPDGRIVYFTSEIETGEPARRRDFRNRSGIFIADRNGMELSNVRPFKYNSELYDIGHPSVTSDGRYLFFASDMPGGQGGSDIYRCEFTDGEWSEPVNLGPEVNSPYVENYPFMHASGRLYFTSNRPGGPGGLDVWYSTLTVNGWDTPILLPEPLNSEADDFAFITQPDLLLGYFTSNRRRNDDIYEFKSTIIRKSSCDPLEINNYCFEFIEENAVKYDTIPFRYEWRFGDGNMAEGHVVEHCYPGPGRYIVELDVTNLVTLEKMTNIKSDIVDVRDIEQPYISGPDTAYAGEKLEFSASETYLPGWDIGTYYWNFDDETVAIGMDVEKTFSRAGTYNIQLIVSAKPEQGGTLREVCVSMNINILPRP
jgi:hypothetical protein